MDRLARLRKDLGEAGCDALLVSQPESRYYLSGYTGHDLPPRDSAGYLLVTATRALLLTDARTSEQASQEAAAFEVVAYASGVLGPETIAKSALSTGINRLGFEAVHLPYAVWRDVGAHLDGSDVQLVPADGLVDRLRIVKDAAELTLLQQAVDVLDRCFAHIVERLEPGTTERQVAREVERYLLDQADGPSFPSIVASGPNGSMPHAVPTDRVIQAGEGITIDIGARVAGYCSDMTRTISLGRPRNARLGDLYAVVVEAQAHAERHARAGMTGREVDALARSVVARAGYGAAFTHSLGHGIGLEVHEPPWLSPLRGTDPLQAGMVFSIEPGIYLPGWGGVRIEDLVVLDETGAHVLCQSPKTLEVSL